MLWTIFVIVLALWLLGFSLHIAGGMIHLLLVAALAVFIFNLVTGRQHAV
jgi:polyferredoxin